jgi:hypothetical protein
VERRGRRERGRVERGERGRGKEGKRGRGEEGKRGRGEEGKRGRGEEGKRERGKEGKRERGEGKRERGERGRGEGHTRLLLGPRGEGIRTDVEHGSQEEGIVVGALVENVCGRTADHARGAARVGAAFDWVLEDGRAG